LFLNLKNDHVNHFSDFQILKFSNKNMEQTASSLDIRELNERILQQSAFIELLTMELNKAVVGQKHMVERLLIGLLANGHVLLEGVPGLAKTLAIKSLASAIHARFARIQFT